jgi:spore germination protein PC
MYQDLNQILQSMQSYMYQQDKKIQYLQTKLMEMEKRISDLQNRPPVHVERMEYKFDQLKVERLEGTLNIGLNPSDLQSIEDFSVPNQNQNLSNVSEERVAIMNEIEDAINPYLNENLLLIMRDAGQKLGIEIDESYHGFILQDIKKQMPNRIEYYLNQMPRNDQISPEQQNTYIIEQLKKEIQQGVLTFLQHLPNNMKGAKVE